MKKSFVILSLCLLFCMNALAQSRNVVFSLEPTSFMSTLSRSSVESNLTKLLTAINQAHLAKSNLNLQGIKMEEGAKKNLEMLWKNMHFYCEQSNNVAPLLDDTQGYQVRGIEITLVPLMNYDGALERELTISMNKAGTLTGVRMALENNQVNDILKKGSVVTDTRQRMEILKFVEDFRVYYNEKNLAALEKVYADDALIISGSILKNVKEGNMMVPTVKYRKENKEQYLARMKTMFARKEYIDVDFDRIQVQKNGASGKEDYYAVTLHQSWTSKDKNGSIYHDDGWLFLLWDFRDPDNPMIHVRTWQPEAAAQKDGIFDMHDFQF